MDKHRLLSHIANRITTFSKFYDARIVREPKLYYDLIDGRIMPFLKNGILIERTVLMSYLSAEAFLFEPDIIRYVTKMSHHDKDFAMRLAALCLNTDDIETMVRTLTSGKLKPYLKGRKKFEEFNDED